LKWGPYSDLDVLRKLNSLKCLSLGGATRVASIEPLTSLPGLQSLELYQTYLLDGLSSLGQLTSLTRLVCGGSIDSDRNVKIRSLDWVRDLSGLAELRLPGTRLIDSDLSVLLELPELLILVLPLRRSYRKQVFQFASSSAAFAGVAKDYEECDDYLAEIKVSR